MSSVSAIPDSNPTRAQLRLVVLGQWVRAGLELARGASAGRGLVGGAVALWRIFQAVRLAVQLAQRLSELQGVLSLAASETAPGEAEARAQACDEPPCNAAFLRHALIEISGLIRDALGLAPDRRGRPCPDKTATSAAEPEVPRAIGRLTPPRERPPDRPPDPERWRRPYAAGVLETALTPLAALASGRFRLAGDELPSNARAILLL